MTTPEKSAEEMVEEFIDKCTDPETGELHIGKYDHEFLEKLLTQTLQAERQKRDELVERIKMTADDVWKVGDHYWAGDYEPSHYELMMLAESYNDIMKRKLT